MHKLFNTALIASLLFLAGCLDHRELTSPSQLRVEDYATGLAGPLGMAMDPKGQLWVTEVATGRVSVVTPDGKSYPAITGFTVALSPENMPDGLNHLAYRDGWLYILHGVDDKLYKVNVSSFKPGDQPMMASSLASEPIGQFVVDYKFAEDTGESNLYNLTFAPNGDMFIADAAANAVIKRTPSGTLSVLAPIPGIPNPTAVGPPNVQAVPTGVAFDGQKLLVTTLLGFPFPAGKARIYQVDMAGNVSLFQEGYTSLVDILLGADKRPIVLSVAQFGQMGPTPNTGTITQFASGQNTTLLSGLNLPTDLEAGAANTFYMTSLGSGKIQKITY
ncbi:ScyD/ScyE family protein [Spirosoma sp. KUDC1026]|uniref:ScyD/ScyE family protein n=1 Tax=Spirosoma sp. KUDC1026 TaxID=2745947 RepID=UPI00159BCB24|nr:ScyD/ScyE family protein [Spirosoma sp. KUDC1026]QKZ15575.1 ScyD/ScyE family protein [Spirosoma sp. KUDC1026]